MGRNDSSRIYELGEKISAVEVEQKRTYDSVRYVIGKVQELEHEVLRRILFQVSMLVEEERNGKPLQRVMDESLEAMEAIEAFVKARPDCERDPRLRLALGKISSVHALAFRYVNEEETR